VAGWRLSDGRERVYEHALGVGVRYRQTTRRRDPAQAARGSVPSRTKTTAASVEDRAAPSEPPTRYVAKLGVELPALLVSIRMTAFIA
jgi:hypothetical protein